MFELTDQTALRTTVSAPNDRTTIASATPISGLPSAVAVAARRRSQTIAAPLAKNQPMLAT